METPDGKGKGKETADPPEADTQDPSRPSRGLQANAGRLLSRLGGSASALANSVVGGPPTVASLASSSSGKGAGGSSQQPTAMSDPIYQERQVVHGYRTSFASSSHRSEQGDSDFAAFLAGSPHLATGPGNASESYGGQQAPDIPIRSPTAQHDEQSTPSHGPTVAAQAARDGLEVVELLSRPDFDAQWPEDVTGDYETDGPTAVSLDDRETSRLESALFGDRAGVGAASQEEWNLLLDFVPAQLQGPGDRPLDGDMVALLGVTDAAQARDVWLSHWGRILDRYTDEVWGDLSPLVREARHEVARPVDKASSVDAVMKLRSVLAHVRARL